MEEWDVLQPTCHHYQPQAVNKPCLGLLTAVKWRDIGIRDGVFVPILQSPTAMVGICTASSHGLLVLLQGCV